MLEFDFKIYLLIDYYLGNKSTFTILIFDEYRILNKFYQQISI